MCADYRHPNSVSQADAYPMSCIDELINQLGKARYTCISTTDLAGGYWQVPVGAASRDKTAFVTLRGLFQFRVMPFRLHGALATFQWLMDWVINGLDAFAAAFLDDLVIHSST